MVKKKKTGFKDPLFSPDPLRFKTPEEGYLYAHILRSPVAHAKVLGVVHPPLPKGFTFILQENLPGMDSFQFMRNRFPLLNNQEVQYIGEPMGLLAGPDAQTVQDFAKHIRFITRKFTLEEAFQESPALKVKELAGGAFLPPDTLETVLVEGVYTSGTQNSEVSSPMAITANYREEGLWLEVPTQWPAQVIQTVARVVNMDPSKVYLLPVVVSANQDLHLWFSSFLAAHVAILSKCSGKPVKLVLDKEEEFRFSPKRPETRVLIRSVVNKKNGKILQYNANLVLSFGAYPIMEDEILDRTLVALLTPYKMESYQVSAHVEISHTPPRGSLGGYGEALGAFALESHIEDICGALNLDPLVWRQENVLLKDQIAFTGEAFRFDIPLTSLLQELGKHSDFSRKYASFRLLNSRVKEWRDEALPLRGVGLALGFQGNGFLAGGSSPVNLEVRMEEDQSLSVYLPLLTPNQPMIDYLKRILADSVKVPFDEVHICPVFTGEHPTGGPSIMSRTFEVLPKLMKQIGEQILQKKEKQKLPFSVFKVYRRNKGPAWDAENFCGQPFMSFSWITAAAEVEVLPILAEVNIKKIILVVDAGPINNIHAAKAALTEGVMTALGWISCEYLVWEKLSLSHGNYLKYRMPQSKEIPEIEIHFQVNGKTPQSKGLGYLGAIVTAPAVLNAIVQAVNPEWRSIPVTRKMLDEALRNHETELDS